jgi:hypothetical protein
MSLPFSTLQESNLKARKDLLPTIDKSDVIFAMAGNSEESKAKRTGL